MHIRALKALPISIYHRYFPPALDPLKDPCFNLAGTKPEQFLILISLKPIFKSQAKIRRIKWLMMRQKSGSVLTITPAYFSAFFFFNVVILGQVLFFSLLYRVGNLGIFHLF